MIIKQLRSEDGTGTLTYFLIDNTSGTAAVIDPNLEDIDNIKYHQKELDIKVTHIIDTHTHADHYSGATKLKGLYNAHNYMHSLTKNKPEVLRNAAEFGIEDILNFNVNIKPDVYLNDGDIVNVGSTEIKVIHTPGHTDNHIALYAEDSLFTGDLLLIGQAGRTDLPGGNIFEQYDSIFNKIIRLPHTTKIYPGHDYENNEFSYLSTELANNPFLKKRTIEEYSDFVKDFFPPIADLAGKHGKAILQCGTKRVLQQPGLIRSVTPDQLYNMFIEGIEMFLLDVREPFELFEGKIDGVVNIPLGQLSLRLNDLPGKSELIVSICARGNRSFEAAHYLIKHGFSNVVNLEGGTVGWLQYSFSANHF